MLDKFDDIFNSKLSHIIDKYKDVDDIDDYELDIEKNEIFACEGEDHENIEQDNFENLVFDEQKEEENFFAAESDFKNSTLFKNYLSNTKVFNNEQNSKDKKKKKNKKLRKLKACLKEYKELYELVFGQD